MMPKKSKGRQKIQMTRMEKESNLLVTFSKRRSGLFKKASELGILCGVEIAIIVFSPGKKVFSFGHPSVETIINRFLTRNPNPSPHSSTSQLVEAHRHANIYDLNRQLTCEISRLEVEKSKSDHLSKIRKLGQEHNWWEAPIETLGLEELEKLKVAMGLLKKNIEEQKKKHWAEPVHPMSIAQGFASSMGVTSDHNEIKGLGLGLSMTPNGFVLGYGHHSG